ncbi:MAG: hypothetical protein ACLQVJ_05840 [Syntrophobacteraceae bacterium]
MNQNQLLKQMIDFNRTSFENAFNTMTMFQEQAEKAANASLDQATWMPREGRTVVDEWSNALKNWRESFKNSMNENFKKIEAFFANFQKGE